MFFALCITGVMILVHPITNRPVSILSEFIWEIAFSIPWIFGTPIVLWIARRYPLQSKNYFKNGMYLFISGIVLSTVLCIVHGLIIFLLQSDTTSFEMNIILTSLFYNIDKMLIVYSALVIMQHAMDFYVRYQEKELSASKLETQLSQAQMIALKMQLQPHFLFNTLNAIVTLVHRDAAMAEEMIVRLSDFLRMTLDASGKQIISLKEELNFIKSYIAIEEIRFNGRLQYSEDVPLKLYDAQLPMLILQPLVENAVKHGFSQFASAQVLQITAERRDGQLMIIVRDDAAPAERLTGMKEGIGLTNTRNRIHTLYGEYGSVDVDTNKVSGVSVRLMIPYSVSAS